MTDFGGWPHLIARQEAPIHMEECDGWQRPCHGGIYPMLPINEYQLGNLLGLLKRSQDKDNGDWWWELVNIAIAAMDILHIEELKSNWGDTFTAQSLRSGEWLQEKTT